MNEEKFVALEDDGGLIYYGPATSSAATRTARLRQGRAEFYGKVRGVRVSTQVVEQAIQEHPAVVEVAVIAVPDELAGARLHAAVQLGPQTPSSTA